MKYFIFLMLLAISNKATANEIIAVCTNAIGYGTYIEDGVLIKPGEGGWENDKISEGEWILMKNGEKFDVIFKDATGVTQSYSDSGAYILPTFISPDEIMLVATYGAVTEVYGFVRNSDSITDTMFLNQIKFGVLNKLGAYKAKCGQFKIIQANLEDK